MPFYANSSDHNSAGTIVDMLYQGDISRTEAFCMLLDLIHDDNIEALIASIPEMWRDEFAEFLASYAQPDVELIDIVGGIKSWEWEPDSVRREEGRRADHLHRETDLVHFRALVLPSIHAWLKRRAATQSSQSE